METSLKQQIVERRITAMMTSSVVSFDKLRQMLLDAAEANRTKITVDIACEDTGVKKSCPFDVAGKVSRLSGFIQRKGGMYQRAVEKQREKEGHPEPSYEAEAPNYAWIDQGPFAEMKDRLCLPMKVESSQPLYYDSNGNVISDDLTEWLKGKASPIKQELKKPVDWRAPYATNIIEAQINGEAVCVL